MLIWARSSVAWQGSVLAGWVCEKMTRHPSRLIAIFHPQQLPPRLPPPDADDQQQDPGEPQRGAKRDIYEDDPDQGIFDDACETGKRLQNAHQRSARTE